MTIDIEAMRKRAEEALEGREEGSDCPNCGAPFYVADDRDGPSVYCDPCSQEKNDVLAADVLALIGEVDRLRDEFERGGRREYKLSLHNNELMNADLAAQIEISRLRLMAATQDSRAGMAAAAERELCAKLCDFAALAPTMGDAKDLAKTIRARGEPNTTNQEGGSDD